MVSCWACLSSSLTLARTHPRLLTLPLSHPCAPCLILSPTPSHRAPVCRPQISLARNARNSSSLSNLHSHANLTRTQISHARKSHSHALRRSHLFTTLIHLSHLSLSLSSLSLSHLSLSHISLSLSSLSSLSLSLISLISLSLSSLSHLSLSHLSLISLSLISSLISHLSSLSLSLSSLISLPPSHLCSSLSSLSHSLSHPSVLCTKRSERGMTERTPAFVRGGFCCRRPPEPMAQMAQS